MLPTSREYQAAMEKPVRDPCHLKLNFGIVNLSAAADAVITADANLYSNVQRINAEFNISTQYATFERDFLRLDGTQLSLAENNYVPQGYISQSVSDTKGIFNEPPNIQVAFTEPRSLVGLSFDFDDKPPAQITVLSYLNKTLVNTQTINKNITADFKHEFLLDGIDALVIRFDKTVTQFNRARLNHLTFGIGYTFSNLDIMNLSETRSASPVSAALPKSSLQFSLFNDNDRFAISSEMALVRFLAEGQPIDIFYGQELEDGGIEWLPSLGWALSSWNVDGINASFTANGAIADMTKNLYEKSLQTDSGNIGEAIYKLFIDADIAKFYINPYLYSLSGTNPIPLLNHAEAAQLLCGAAAAQLREKRTGGIEADMLFYRPQITVSASGGDSISYSDPNTIIVNILIPMYASYETDFFRLDGTQNLLPIVPYDASKTGFISGAIYPFTRYQESAKIPSLRCIFDSPVDVYSVTLDFGGCMPKEISIEGGGNTELFHPKSNIETFTFIGYRCTNVFIWFVSMQKDGQRAHLKHASFEMDCGFVLKKHQFFGNEKGTLAEKASTINAEYVFHQMEWERPEGGGMGHEKYTKFFDASVPAGEWIHVEHGVAPIYMVYASVPIGYTCEIQSYAYVTYARVLGASGTSVLLQLTGVKTTSITGSVLKQLAQTGSSCEIRNPLISTKECAERPTALYAKYMSERTKYEISTCAYPELEPLDTISLFEKGNHYVILETKLEFSGALRETLLLRKAWD